MYEYFRRNVLWQYPSFLGTFNNRFRKWASKSVELDKELRADFPEAEELIDKHERARNEVTEIMSYQQFVYGFRVGAQLMAEMMKKVN